MKQYMIFFTCCVPFSYLMSMGRPDFTHRQVREISESIDRIAQRITQLKRELSVLKKNITTGERDENCRRVIMKNAQLLKEAKGLQVEIEWVKTQLETPHRDPRKDPFIWQQKMVSQRLERIIRVAEQLSPAAQEGQEVLQLKHRSLSTSQWSADHA